ncbi:MAG: hypothetical protein ACYS0I_03890 [Planctomycetota bacterium]
MSLGSGDCKGTELIVYLLEIISTSICGDEFGFGAGIFSAV